MNTTTSARNGTRRFLPAFGAIGAPLLAASGAAAEQSYAVNQAAPALDRWMYPFNPTPGIRPTISTFASTPGGTDFDVRDGQMLLRFDTGGTIPTGLGSGLYAVDSLRITVQFANDMVAIYDDTQDPWQCFTAEGDPNHVEDADPGQPVELYGCGFRNGYSLQTFLENSPFTVSPNSPLTPGVRNAYAMGFGAEGQAMDVSNNVREQFDPTPWAIGTVDGLAPGDPIPLYTFMTFEVNVSDPAVQSYLRAGLDSGRLMFAITSMTAVVQQGGPFPSFYSKENQLVPLGFAFPASIELQARTGPFCATADLNCDGAVNGADLGVLIGNWGGSGTGDLNADGVVNGADLGVLIGGWTG